MKNIFLIVTLLIGLTTVAQKTKGRVFFDVEITSDNPQMQMALPQMEGSALEVAFAPGKTKAIFDMGSFITQTTITDKDSENALVLMDGMMGKIAMQPKESDLTEEEKKLTEREVELIDETKEIIGFTCKKAKVTSSEGVVTIVWYAPDLMPDYRKGNMYMMEEIPGLPLEFTFVQGPMTMKCTAYEFTKKIKKIEKYFSMEIPKGYELKTVEEVKQMQKPQ